ncbi:hypothetical protein LCGC14_2699000 [marine sediment metagenome]|uniref:HNH nuclease domain-containing protein n=1 Tax=marine sediment metagenome TaxID=412755 RepID=A0A0F9C841_9ZZZZ
MRVMNKICSVDGCDSVMRGGKGLCSTHYQRLWRRGNLEVSNRPEGTGTIGQGYLNFTINGRRISEHRLVVERFLGRRLSPKEYIHHINGDTLDNRIENLRIVTAKTHRSHHNYLGYYTFRGSSATHRYCPRCKTIKPNSDFSKRNERRRAGYCKVCFNHYYSHRYVETCPLCNP